MSRNAVTGIQITKPEDWALRHAESWGVRAAAAPGSPEKDWANDLSALPRTLLLKSSHPYVDLLEEPAHHYTAPHYHTESEVMVVLSGRMIINGEWCGVGSVIIVPANEEYWHATHEEACLVAVIRPVERGLLMPGVDTRLARSGNPA